MHIIIPGATAIKNKTKKYIKNDILKSIEIIHRQAVELEW